MEIQQLDGRLQREEFLWFLRLTEKEGYQQQVVEQTHTCDDCSRIRPFCQSPTNCPGKLLVPLAPHSTGDGWLTFNKRLSLDRTTTVGLEPKQTLPAAL